MLIERRQNVRNAHMMKLFLCKYKFDLLMNQVPSFIDVPNVPNNGIIDHITDYVQEEGKTTTMR